MEFGQGVTKLKENLSSKLSQKFVLNSEEDSGKSDPDNITLTATLRLDWTRPDFFLIGSSQPFVIERN